MRILIAEDEFIERKTMKKFIDDNFKTMEVIGEAVNGREAIEQAKSLSPDLIIMDIKMPGIDGIEALKEIYTFAPTTKFMMVSAYDSFEYAKEAMAYGVKDYILKPGKRIEIVEALLRIEKEMKAEQAQRMHHLQSDVWREEHFMKKVIQHPLQEDAYTLQRELFPNMHSGFFLVLMSNGNLPIGKVNDAIGEALHSSVFTLERESYIMICVLSQAPIEKEKILLMAQQLHYSLEKDAYIGAGSPYEGLKNIRKSFSEAYHASFYLKTNEKRQYGFLDQKNKATKQIIKEISQLVERGNGTAAVLRYQESNVHLEDADKEYMYIELMELLHKEEIDLLNSKISTLKTEEDWCHFIEMCSMKLKEFYESQHSMKQVKDYLLENYHQNIQLDEVAEMVGLSANYFSHLFKETFQVNFITYVTNLRLEKAKKLIKENRNTLKEISFMVGYKDPNYFSRVFKKHFEQSPKQFKEEILKK